jgi:hypothetical protein
MSSLTQDEEESSLLAAAAGLGLQDRRTVSGCLRLVGLKEHS